KPLLAAVGLIAAAVVAYQVAIVGPREARIAALPEALQTQYRRVIDTAEVETAEARAAAVLAAGEAALARGDYDEAAQAIDELEALAAGLAQGYKPGIVSRPGESSGVWRIPDDNPRGQNFYLIVEAIGPDGRALTLPIRNEEDGRTYEVARFGLRVDEPTFRRVETDKRDDGIIQADLVGRKRSGYLEPEYEIETSGGAITRW